MRVHRGVSRSVLIVGRWAIKVPTTRPYGRRGDRLWAWTRGVQANKSELDWSEVDGVAPVLHSWLGGIVQVYPRCAPAVGEEFEWLDHPNDPRWRGIGDTILPNGDRKRSNVGVLNGRLVWIDYDTSWNGCPHDRWVYAGDEEEAA